MEDRKPIDGNLFVLQAVEGNDQIYILFKEGDNTATVSYDMGVVASTNCKTEQVDKRIAITGDLKSFTIEAVITCDLSHITGGNLNWEYYPNATSVIESGADFIQRAEQILGLSEPDTMVDQEEPTQDEGGAE